MEDYSTFSDVEKLIVKQAFVNAVADDVKTKNPDNLRGRLDAAMAESYYGNPMAPKSFDLKLLGQKVGTYSLTVSKPKPSTTSLSVEVDDKEAFADWAEKNGYVTKTVDMDAVVRDLQKSGVVPDGCTPIEVVTPEVAGGTITRSTVKVDPREVARVLGAQLAPVVQYLLGDGDD